MGRWGGWLDRLSSSHTPQSSNLSLVRGALNPTFGAPDRSVLKPLFHRSLRHRPVVPMADARRVCAERRAACVAQMAPVGNSAPRRSASPVANDVA